MHVTFRMPPLPPVSRILFSSVVSPTTARLNLCRWFRCCCYNQGRAFPTSYRRSFPCWFTVFHKKNFL